MKRMRKLFSVLLAAALVAQMGVVIGMGESNKRNSADHGQKEKDVSEVGGCTAPAHWLTRPWMMGGAGRNYYYPTSISIPTPAYIYCSTGRNIIILTSDRPEKGLEVNGFGDAGSGDVVYVPKGEKWEYLKAGIDGQLSLTGSGYEYSITFVNGPETLSIQPMPEEPKISTLKVTKNSGTVTIEATLEEKQPKKATSEEEPPKVYLWERKQGNDKEFTFLQATAENNIKVDQSTPGLWTYGCTIIDEAGQLSKRATTDEIVVGCHVTPQLGEILFQNEQNQQAELKGELPIKGKVIYPLTVKPTYNEDNCKVVGHGESNHGCQMKWEIAPKVEGITLTNHGTDATLTIDPPPEWLTEDGVDMKITAALVNKDGETVAERGAEFTVKKQVTSLSTEPDEGEKPGTNQDPNKSDTPTVGDDDKKDPDNPNPPPTTTPEPSCAKEPEKVTISGADRIDEKSGKEVRYRAEIEFNETTACSLKEHETEEGKDHGWKAEWKLSGGSGYAEVDGTGKVTITPEKLPTTETKLTLTATLTKAGTAAKTTPTTATREITFVRSAACNWEARMELQHSNKELPFSNDEVKNGTTKEESFTAQIFSSGVCGAGHDHETVTWSVGDISGVDIKVNDGDSKQATVKVDPQKLQNQQTQVTVTAAVKNGDGTEAKATATLNVTRPIICLRRVATVTISGKEELSVPVNRVVSTQYTADKTYDDGICDEPGHSAAKGHGEAATKWTLGDNPNNVFTLDPSGRLTINGSKLEEGGSVQTTISAEAGNKTASYDVTVRGIAPATDSGSDDSSDDREWESLEDKLDDARKGDTVKVNLGDNADVPFYVFDAIRGRNVDLEMKVSGGYTWSVNGKSVKKFPGYQIYIPLDVESYKNSKMEKLCRDSDVRAFRLRHEGSFFADMKLTMDLGQGRASKVLYLYGYDEDQNRLTYCSSAKADGYGNVSFVLARSLGAYVVTNKALYGENPVTSGGGAVSGSGNITAIYPPVAPATSAQAPSSSSASSEASDGESSSEDSAAPTPAASTSEPPVRPADTPVKAENDTLPVLVPILVLCIAGVITATALIVRGSRGKVGPVCTGTTYLRMAGKGGTGGGKAGKTPILCGFTVGRP